MAEHEIQNNNGGVGDYQTATEINVRLRQLVNDFRVIGEDLTAERTNIEAAFCDYVRERTAHNITRRKNTRTIKAMVLKRQSDLFVQKLKHRSLIAVLKKHHKKQLDKYAGLESELSAAKEALARVSEKYTVEDRCLVDK